MLVATVALCACAGDDRAADSQAAGAGGGSACDGFPLRWTRAKALADIARERAEHGFRRDQRYLERRARRIRQDGRRTWVVSYTRAEREYLGARERLWSVVRIAHAYIRRHAANVSGGVEIEDAWPSPALVRARFTRDVERHVAAIRARLEDPGLVRGLEVERGERELNALAERVQDDRKALDAEGLHVVSVEPDLESNVVDVSLWTRRTDGVQALVARYGGAVRGEVVGDTGAFEACTNLFGYRSSRAGRVVHVEWGHSGMVRLARLEVRETARRVIIGVVVRIPHGPLTLDLMTHTERVRLRRPLGRRIVIDRSDGTRVPCRRAPGSSSPAPSCHGQRR